MKKIKKTAAILMVILLLLVTVSCGSKEEISETLSSNQILEQEEKHTQTEQKTPKMNPQKAIEVILGKNAGLHTEEECEEGKVIAMNNAEYLIEVGQAYEIVEVEIFGEETPDGFIIRYYEPMLEGIQTAGCSFMLDLKLWNQQVEDFINSQNEEAHEMSE